MVLAHGGQGEWNRLGSSGKEEITTGRPALTLPERQAGQEIMMRNCGDPGLGLFLIPALFPFDPHTEDHQVDNIMKKIEITKLPI